MACAGRPVTAFTRAQILARTWLQVSSDTALFGICSTFCQDKILIQIQCRLTLVLWTTSLALKMTMMPWCWPWCWQWCWVLSLVNLQTLRNKPLNWFVWSNVRMGIENRNDRFLEMVRFIVDLISFTVSFCGLFCPLVGYVTWAAGTSRTHVWASSGTSSENGQGSWNRNNGSEEVIVTTSNRS